MKNQATNTQFGKEKNLSEEEIMESLRSSTTCAYMFSASHSDIDSSNLINHGKGGPRYNIFGHHNKLSYIRRTSDAEVALKHFASTVNEIVGYCFEPPATQSAIWP